MRSKLPEISHRPMRLGQTIACRACHSRDYSQTGQAAVAHVVYSNAWSTSMTWPHHVTSSSIISLGAHDITSTASQQLSQPESLSQPLRSEQALSLPGSNQRQGPSKHPVRGRPPLRSIALTAPQSGIFLTASVHDTTCKPLRSQWWMG